MCANYPQLKKKRNYNIKFIDKNIFGLIHENTNLAILHCSYEMAKQIEEALNKL